MDLSMGMGTVLVVLAIVACWAIGCRKDVRWSMGTILVVLAIVACWAIGRGKDVSVSLNLPGANASLEVRDPGIEREGERAP